MKTSSLLALLASPILISSCGINLSKDANNTIRCRGGSFSDKTKEYLAHFLIYVRPSEKFVSTLPLKCKNLIFQFAEGPPSMVAENLSFKVTEEHRSEKLFSVYAVGKFADERDDGVQVFRIDRVLNVRDLN